MRARRRKFVNPKTCYGARRLSRASWSIIQGERPLQPGPDRRRVTFGLLLGTVIAAVETTAVSAAMPTVVGDLGGVERYSWIFTAYLLASTVTVPLYGKFADLYGRRRIFQLAVAIFLLGSVLCGLARSIDMLIVCRALQGRVGGLR
jgi:MFS family permease